MTALKETIVPGLFAVFAVVYLVTTRDLPIESTVFPRFLIAVMLMIAAVILFQTFMRPRAAAEDQPGAVTVAEAWRPVLVLAASAGYLALFSIAGFIPASFVFLAVLMPLLGVPLLRAIVIAAVFTAALYLVFGELFLVNL
jgi:putative tricarboxylic transport membrane protein